MAISAGFIFIWLGAFFDGTNVGNPTRLPWGMNFPALFDRRHPIQLYGMLAYTLLFAFLAWVEPRYRTFNWYRDKKHSAQTGFLFCVACIVYGLVGAIFGLLSPPQLVVFGFPLDIPLRVVIFFYGLLLLYTRTGRPLWPTYKPKAPAPTETMPEMAPGTEPPTS
jgi:prolipoprotein diacylglyceryltransferase